MHEVLVNRLGGLSLPRKSVVRLTDRPDMTLDVYRGRKTTIQYNTCTKQDNKPNVYHYILFVSTKFLFMENTVLESFDIKFFRRDQKQRKNDEACRASPTCFWLNLINLI